MQTMETKKREGWAALPRRKEAGIAYYRGGEGAPVMLLHGVGLRLESWHRQIAALQPRCAVYAPDMPGHGGKRFAALGDDAGRLCRRRCAIDSRHHCRAGDSCRPFHGRADGAGGGMPVCAAVRRSGCNERGVSADGGGKTGGETAGGNSRKSATATKQRRHRAGSINAMVWRQGAIKTRGRFAANGCRRRIFPATPPPMRCLQAKTAKATRIWRR